MKCPNSHLNPGDIEEIAQRFHSNYQDRYSISEPASELELVMWRMVATGLVDPATRPELNHKSLNNIEGSTHFYDIASSSFVEAKMANPDYMSTKETIKGPALLVATDTTIVVPSGYRRKDQWRLSLDYLNEGLTVRRIVYFKRRYSSGSETTHNTRKQGNSSVLVLRPIGINQLHDATTSNRNNDYRGKSRLGDLTSGPSRPLSERSRARLARILPAK